MNRIIITLIASLFATSVFAQQQTLESSGQAIVDKLIKDKSVAGVSVSFSKGEDYSWSYASGKASESEEYQVSHKGRIASIAKSFTSVAVMQLVEQGKIDIDNSLQTYVADYPVKPEGEITVRHLLNHTSGISAYESGKEANSKIQYDDLTAASMIFRDRDLLGTPGVEEFYTTYGYVVLGLVIESASGMSYEDYVQKYIFDKAGMKNTGVEHFSVDYDHKASLYHNHGKGKIKPAKMTNLSSKVPGGGFYSTTEDLVLFGQCLLNGELVSQESIDAMWTDPGVIYDGNPYGFGFFLYGENEFYGHVVGHTGGQSGCSSVMLILPDSDAVITVMSNTSGSGGEVFQLAVELMHLTDRE